MAATLPVPNQCCSPCDDTIIQQIAGPQGAAGADGADGADGANAFTLFTANFTIPAELGTDTATVADTSWMAISQKVYAARADGSVHAFFEVTAIGGATSVTLMNLEDTPNDSYLENSAPGSILITGSKLMPAGIQGPDGNTTGAAAGDLKGTYPSPQIGIGNAKGSSLWGNGTDTVAVAAGTDGHMLAYDSTDAEGVKSFKALPLTADTDVADMRVPRLDRPAGTEVPSPLQSSKMTITDNGAVRADGSGGNARGTDANDLQVTRSNVAMVASGTNSVIAGGADNTASGARSAVVGGTTGIASGQESFIGGGNQCIASATFAAIAGGFSCIARSRGSAVCGGEVNIAGDGAGLNVRAFVGGGENNTAEGQESCICGGDGNTASGTQSAIGGGDNNDASGSESVVAGGGTNTASAQNSSVLGGDTNVASGNYSAVIGGFHALANKYGQIAHASGRFAAGGDAQASEVTLRNSSANATPVELFLDGSATRLTVPTNTSWMFQMKVVVRQDTGLDSIYKSEGVIRNNAGTTSVNAVTTTEIYDGIGLPATPVVVDADDPNDSLRITCTGVAATNLRWFAVVSLAEVSY